MEKPLEKQILTNEERRYFGLEPILPDWERFEIKPGFLVYFDGDMIRKTVSYYTLPGTGYEDFLSYGESDTEIQTRERRIVLPRTERGKEKKLNYTSVSAVKPTGCTFRMNLSHPNQRSGLWAGNVRNSISLPVVFPGNIDTLPRFRKWLSDFMDARPADYFDKVERMKNTPHRTVKYFNGDIFRFEIDLEHYGFGLIIGQIKKMKKDGLLKKEHILCSTMGVPLLVRLYQIKTKEKNMDIETITAYPLGKTFIMMDNQVIWGVYDIVGSKELKRTDIDFPIQAGRSINHQDRNYAALCWGCGAVVKRDIADFPEPLRSNRLMRHGCWFGAGAAGFETARESDFGGNHLDELEKTAFQYFDIPLDTTFDAFNEKYGGMTREEYAEYANKAGRRR